MTRYVIILQLVVLSLLVACGADEPTFTTQTRASCLTFTNDAYVVLVREDISKAAYDLPGGHRDGNETPYETAKREVKEETGLDVVSADFIGITADTIYFACETVGEVAVQSDDAGIYLFPYFETLDLKFTHVEVKPLLQSFVLNNK